MNLKEDLIKVANSSPLEVLNEIDSQLHELNKKRFILNYLFLEETIQKIQENNSLPMATAEFSLEESSEGNYSYLSVEVYHSNQRDLSYTDQEKLVSMEGKLAYAISRFNTENIEYFGDIQKDTVCLALNKENGSDLSRWIMSRELCSILEENQLEISLPKGSPSKRKMKI